MPMMDFTYPADAIAPAALDALCDELTTVLLRAERAPDTQFFRDITWLHLHAMPPGAQRTDGRPVAAPIFRVEATVPTGALSDRRKQEFVAAATTAVRTAAGLPESEALRVWVLIREVPDGNWGAGGQVIQFEQLRQMAAAQREQAAEPAV